MAQFKVGDRVEDINPTWPNYGCTGVVTSVNRNFITWRNDKNNQLVTDKEGDLRKVMPNRNRQNRNRQNIISNQTPTPFSGTSGTPENQTGWDYHQSQHQLMFFFSSDIINITTNPNDVIGVFKGDICLGWRYADFTQQYIDVPMMLKDPNLNFNEWKYVPQGSKPYAW